MDLAIAFNNEKKQVLQDKILKLKEEEQDMLKKREGYTGNKYDADVKKKDFEND